jgi:formylglycine-generating enzyme
VIEMSVRSGWLAIVLLAGCTSDPPGQAVDSGPDADVDADTDTDTDTDADADADTDTDTDTDADTLEWVPIPGGTFWMGTEGAVESSDEYPYHEVTVPSFEMLRSEVTMGQYAACVADGACGEPLPDTDDPPQMEDWEEYVTWGAEGREEHPINCVNWYQAVEFCEWAGGRLPSEAEWEYAARSLGQDRTYPWGEAEPTCEYAIMWEHGGTEYACDAGTTWPVCSRPAGNTEQGLCDMAGSVSEWVMDCIHYGYEGAPNDGSAWESDCLSEGTRMVRGGSFTKYQAVFLRAVERSSAADISWGVATGFRCARSGL